MPDGGRGDDSGVRPDLRGPHRDVASKQSVLAADGGHLRAEVGPDSRTLHRRAVAGAAAGGCPARADSDRGAARRHGERDAVRSVRGRFGVFDRRDPSHAFLCLVTIPLWLGCVF